jgi:hypothetical protein
VPGKTAEINERIKKDEKRFSRSKGRKLSVLLLGYA